jgi:hypothetical protein
MSFAAVAITTAVVGAGAAVASGVMQSQAADKAASAQAKAAKRFNKKLEDIEPPKWDLARDIKEAGQVTDYNLKQMELIFPGAKGQREIAARTADSLMRGEIPKDVQQQIMRSVAELGGAGYRPSSGMPDVPSGFQAPQALLSRQLGLTSLELQQLGQNLSQSWQKLSGAFIESPLQVGQARVGTEKAAADVLSGIASAQYGADVDTIGARFAANMAPAQMVQGIGSALSGAAMGYGQMGAMQGMAGGGFGGGGIPQYTSLSAAQQAAPFASGYSNVQGMGYVPRASSVY